MNKTFDVVLTDDVLTRLAKARRNPDNDSVMRLLAALEAHLGGAAAAKYQGNSKCAFQIAANIDRQMVLADQAALVLYYFSDAIKPTPALCTINGNGHTVYDTTADKPNVFVYDSRRSTEELTTQQQQRVFDEIVSRLTHSLPVE